MSAIRNIVRDFRFEVSAGTRKCDVSKRHEILKGERHFAYEETPGHRINICMLCAPAVLERAVSHMTELINQI